MRLNSVAGRLVLAVMAGWMGLAAASGTAARPRMIVLTDIEADPDDTQSLVRLVLYSNEIDIEGLVATTSVHMQSRIAPESIERVIEGYGKVRANLLLHDGRYPEAARLKGVVKRGRPEYGMGGVGEGKDTEGSEWILKVLGREDGRPLWISVWGGANTLAQALYRLKETKPAAEVERLVGKLRVYTISDQDDAGPWIRKNFPKLFYIVSPGGNYMMATWTGINSKVEGIDNTTISNHWLAEHIQQGHGPLGALYPDVAWGVEGDTPSWLNLIPNGLSEPEHPEWGGWGGRYELYRPEIDVKDPRTFLGGKPIEAETRAIWTNAVDAWAPPEQSEYGRATRAGKKEFRDFRVTLWRWRDDFQNDFAARMEWTTKCAKEANHAPVVVLESAAFKVKSGQGFGLGARQSTDPDGDSLSFHWFPYPEAGTYRGVVQIEGAENAVGAWVVAPKVEKAETLHFIVRVADKGRPSLARYGRVVVTVEP